MDARELREEAVREAKRGLILDAARGVFSQKGFWDTRLEDIAFAAGFSKASLYNYYEDKEAIFLNLAIREYERMADRIAECIDSQGSFEENLEIVLKRIFHDFGEYFAFILTISNYQTMMLLHLDMCKHEELAKRFRTKEKLVRNGIEAMVEIARERGEIGSRESNKQLAGFISALIRGTLFEWKVSGKMGDVDEAIASIIRFVRDGVGIRSSQEGS